MDKIKLLKLKQALMSFEEVITDKGTLVVDGELAVGTEVYVGDEVAADGEYTLEDGRIVVVTEGKISEIKEKEPEQEPEPTNDPEPVQQEGEPTQDPDPEPEPQENEKVAELEAKIQELENVIIEKDAKIQELEDKIAALEKPVDDPLQMRAQAQPQPVKKSGAMKYFEE